MRYESTATGTGTCCDCGENALPTQPLAEIAKETGVLAEDILVMLNRVNGFLFADQQECCEKGAEPRCFLEEVLRTERNLSAACEMLAKLSQLLGL